MCGVSEILLDDIANDDKVQMGNHKSRREVRGWGWWMMEMLRCIMILNRKKPCLSTHDISCAQDTPSPRYWTLDYGMYMGNWGPVGQADD